MRRGRRGSGVQSSSGTDGNWTTKTTRGDDGVPWCNTIGGYYKLVKRGRKAKRNEERKDLHGGCAETAGGLEEAPRELAEAPRGLLLTTVCFGLRPTVEMVLLIVGMAWLWFGATMVSSASSS